MQAIFYSEHGSPDVLRCGEIAKPTPGAGEVLLRVRAAALNPVDWRVLRGGPRFAPNLFGLMKVSRARPIIVGRDVAGVVESAGPGVTDLKPGDAVFGVCPGSVAEYACARAAKLALKPAAASFEEAAAVPVAGLTALQALRDYLNLQPAQKLLINGAAGGIGTFAVQIARSLGAEVTAVCSARNVDLVRSLGAGHVIDYAQQDFTLAGRRFDALLDNVGNYPAAALRRALKPGGRAAIAGAPHEFAKVPGRLLATFLLSSVVREKLRFFVANIHRADLAAFAELMQAGKVKSVIDRAYAMHETADALRYLETGHARAKLVVRIA